MQKNHFSAFHVLLNSGVSCVSTDGPVLKRLLVCLFCCWKTCYWTHTGRGGWILSECKAASGGQGKLTLNNSSIRKCFRRITLSSVELTVCSFCDNVITHPLQQVFDHDPGGVAESATVEISCMLHVFNLILSLLNVHVCAVFFYRVQRKVHTE